MKKKIFKNIRFWLWVILPVLIALSFFVDFSFLFQRSELFFLFEGIVTFITVFYLFYLIFSSLKNFYNNQFIGISVFIVGLLSMYFHIPGGSLFTRLGIAGISSGALYSSIIIIKTIRNSKFLRWYGFTMGIILFFSGIGIFFKINHYPLGTAISYFSIFFFFLALIAMLFLLPMSNYINWLQTEKKIFYRCIIIPMILIFTINSSMFLFPGIFKKTASQLTKNHTWYMAPIELMDKEGLNSDTGF